VRWNYGGCMQVSDVIAGLALVLSVISLLWQARTWRSSGPVIKVSLVRGDELIFIWDLRGPTEAQARHNEARQRWRRHCFVVVRNRGRAPATVESVQMGTSPSWSLDLASYVIAERSGRLPPLRLEPATSVRWLIPLEQVREGIVEMMELRTGRDDPLDLPMVRLSDLRAWVTVGNGDQIASPRWLSERRSERILYLILMPVVLPLTVLQRLLRNRPGRL